MSYRIKPQDFVPLNASPFMTIHGARVLLPIAEALASDELFLNVRSNVRAGDRVTICYFDSGEWTRARVLEHAEVLIVGRTSSTVDFQLIGDVHAVTHAEDEDEAQAAPPSSSRRRSAAAAEAAQ
jgi:hypothetical protein